jgi:hypothetical protein
MFHVTSDIGAGIAEANLAAGFRVENEFVAHSLTSMFAGRQR